MNSERSVSQKHSTFIISVLFWRNTSELIRALTLDLQIKLLQLTFLTIYNQRRIPFILGSVCEWWLVREFLVEKASSETNRDRSAPGSELPHYCTATFCQPTSWQIHRNASDKAEFLPNVDNRSVAICRTNPTRQFRWSVICYLHGLHLSGAACQQRICCGLWE